MFLPITETIFCYYLGEFITVALCEEKCKYHVSRTETGVDCLYEDKERWREAYYRYFID